MSHLICLNVGYLSTGRLMNIDIGSVQYPTWTAVLEVSPAEALLQKILSSTNFLMEISHTSD
jgi:hypothetical protein